MLEASTSRDDIVVAIATFVRQQSSALLVSSDLLFTTRRVQVAILVDGDIAQSRRAMGRANSRKSEG